MSRVQGLRAARTRAKECSLQIPPIMNGALREGHPNLLCLCIKCALRTTCNSAPSRLVFLVTEHVRVQARAVLAFDVMQRLGKELLPLLSGASSPFLSVVDLSEPLSARTCTLW